MPVSEGGKPDVYRGLVEDRRRQELARTLAGAAEPLTTEDLAKATKRPVALVYYHLRALSLVRAVTPSLEGGAERHLVAWSLSVDNLPTWAREVLMGEICFQIVVRLQYLVLFEGMTDADELADELGLSIPELARYVKRMQPELEVPGLRLPRTGMRPDRASDLEFPEWLTQRKEPPEEEEEEGPDGA